MPYDVQHGLEHAEVAGWALGSLDPDDAQTFEEHLRSCDQCQAAVAEFGPVVQGLNHAAPAVEPPDDLEAKTIAAVQHAVTADKRSEEKPGKASRWRHFHWTNPLLPVATALAAAAVTAAAFISIQVLQLTAPAVAATINLHAQPGFSGSAVATARATSSGWEIQLAVKHLSALRPGQFYECWYAGPGNRPGRPELITAGTFIIDRSGNGTVTMWSAANPDEFKIMQITAEQPGDASQHGRVILSGIART